LKGEKWEIPDKLRKFDFLSGQIPQSTAGKIGQYLQRKEFTFRRF